MNYELPVMNDGIAIVGMIGRFPGASNVDELWRNLCEGVESTTFFTEAELDLSIDPDLLRDPNYVKARGIIAGGETFDATFFGITPREAEVMDPQSRVFLELVHKALENAGYVADSFDGLIGLYAGCGQNTYFANHICGRPEIVNRLGEFQTMLANEKDFLTTRAAYKLNLKGPSVTISTACSTSLVAVSQAIESLNNYQCDLAVAGGISMTTPQNSGYLAQEGGMLSGDGHCRSFDVDAQGTMFNNGAGLVVLKRLVDAIEAGDRIYAVIKGVGVNNDGADKVSFTAPSVDGQAQSIAMAQAYADFHPESISYIEAHGTATPLGDPIKIAALTQAFRLQTNAKQFCAIGSIKSNFGHTVAAAGVAGLIKTALSLYHKQIPASLNFTAPNPNLDLANSPFYVNTQLTEWPAGDTPRRAGVSSFGVGGTNAHVVLEEPPPVQSSGSSRPEQLLLLSAKTRTALAAATQNLAQYLQANPDVNLADVAYTLDRGRKAFNYRRCVVGSDPADTAGALQTGDPRRVMARHTEARHPDVVFMFPGQGSQYVNMGVTFYRDEPVFRSVVDRCAELLAPLLGRDIRAVMYPADGDSDTSEISLKQTFFTQPALFVTEYALAQLWISWGVKPQATIGHSIGEFVSACLGEYLVWQMP
jgi:acyl transferase domain-containing protein